MFQICVRCFFYMLLLSVLSFFSPVLPLGWWACSVVYMHAKYVKSGPHASGYLNACLWFINPGPRLHQTFRSLNALICVKFWCARANFSSEIRRRIPLWPCPFQTVVGDVFRRDLWPESAQQAPPPQIKSTGKVCVWREITGKCVWHLGKELSGTAATAGMCIWRVSVCSICTHLCNLHALRLSSVYGPHMLQSINTTREEKNSIDVLLY